MAEQKCTMCGKELDVFDLQQPFGFDHTVGYGSVYDLTHFSIRLCNDCFDKVMGFVLPRCKENPIVTESGKLLIETEREQSLKHIPDTVEFKGHTLAKLSVRNVGCIEAMIATDSAYRLSGNRQAGPVTNRNGRKTYPGSSAYWITRMAEDFTEENIREAVSAVDRENTTHLNADLVGRNEMVQRLMDMGPDVLREELRTRSFLIYDMLASPTHPVDPGHKARENVSFAAKFCHYYCFHVFAGTAEADNFSIWDNEVANILPLYLKYRNLPVPEDMRNYRDYSDSIDELRKDTGISRNGFDHLLWYFHKGARNG